MADWDDPAASDAVSHSYPLAGTAPAVMQPLPKRGRRARRPPPGTLTVVVTRGRLVVLRPRRHNAQRTAAWDGAEPGGEITSPVVTRCLPTALRTAWSPPHTAPTPGGGLLPRPNIR